MAKRSVPAGSPVAHGAAGGPVAKSRDASFAKLTGYIPRDLHLEFKIAVMKQGREISDVVAELVTEWLRNEASR